MAKYYYSDGAISDHFLFFKTAHRVDGPAIEDLEGTASWYFMGKLHRVDGPAYYSKNGYRAWYIHGKRHRLDGPAVEYSHGGKTWFIHGQELLESEFNEHPLVVAYNADKTIRDLLYG